MTTTLTPCRGTAITSTRANGEVLEMTVLHEEAELVIGAATPAERQADNFPTWVVLSREEARALRDLLTSAEVAALLDAPEVA